MERLYILFQQMSNSKTSADITIASYLCITRDGLGQNKNYSLLTDLSVFVLVVLHDQKENSSGLTKFMAD